MAQLFPKAANQIAKASVVLVAVVAGVVGRARDGRHPALVRT